MGCSHNCDSCSSHCGGEKSLKVAANPAASVKKVIGVVSGKGGVGKSLLTSMMAVGMTRKGYTKQELLAYCRKHIAKYAMPYDIEFRDELPKTLVGKVAYRVLEEEAAEQEHQN